MSDRETSEKMISLDNSALNDTKRWLYYTCYINIKMHQVEEKILVHIQILKLALKSLISHLSY